MLGVVFLQVRTATTAEPIAHAILELEALLRPAVFTSIWGPSSQVQPRPAGAPARKGPAGRKPTPKPGKAPATAVSKSGRLNRAASAASGETHGFAYICLWCITKRGIGYQQGCCFIEKTGLFCSHAASLALCIV